MLNDILAVHPVHHIDEDRADIAKIFKSVVVGILDSDIGIQFLTYQGPFLPFNG